MNLRPNGKGRDKGTGHGTNGRGSLLRSILLAVAVFLVGFLLYRQGDRLFAARVPVLVAASGLEAGARLRPQDFVVRRMQEDDVPAGAVSEPQAVEGRELARGVDEGQPLVIGDLVDDSSRDLVALAELIPPGRVLATVKVPQSALPPSTLNRGDRIGILNSVSGRTQAITEDAWFIGHLTSQVPKRESGTLFGIDLTAPGGGSAPASSTSLILALLPADVVRLAGYRSIGGAVTFMLHGRREVEAGEMLAIVPQRRDRTVELLVGGKRNKVSVDG